MVRALIDSSTYFDLLNAPKHQHLDWARNTSIHAISYLNQYPRFTVSGLTVLEVVDGFKRKRMEAAIAKFLDQTLLQFDVIYPDKPILALAGEINATLALGGRSIGVVDCLIAATAITQKITLVNANTKHFARVVQAGYPLDVTNWRIS